MLNGTRCSARKKGTEQQCGHLAVRGRNVCHMHGGHAPRGLAAGRWKDGRYSKALPPSLAAAYERARQDPELIALRDELALVDARLTDLLAGLGRGSSSDLWDALRMAWGKMEAAQRAGATDDVRVQ